jgi:hypothetical protein
LKIKGEVGIVENDINEFTALIFLTLSSSHFDPYLGVGMANFVYYRNFIYSILGDSEEIPSFINLNYDTLLDTAIEEALNIGNKNSIPQNYKIELYNESTGEKIVHGEYILIKPHGSMNMAKCNKCNLSFYSRDNLIAKIENKHAHCPKCGENMNYSQLIPPSYHKDCSTMTTARQIIELTSNANTITIIGYSFPPYDMDMKHLIEAFDLSRIT